MALNALTMTLMALTMALMDFTMALMALAMTMMAFVAQNFLLSQEKLRVSRWGGRVNVNIVNALAKLEPFKN